jgi:ABC-type hemin transport system ATPase subunit
MVGGKIKAIGKPQEVLKSELIEEAYCLPVQVIKHPFLDIPLVLPDKNDQTPGDEPGEFTNT